MLAKSVVWFNGERIGECVTGVAPTSYDISALVRWGGENELVVWLASVEALLDLKNFVGDLLNALGDGPAVLGLQRDGFEDEQVERALNEITRFSHTMFIYNTVV